MLVLYAINFLKFYPIIRTHKRHKATVISGKLIARKILDELKESVETFKLQKNHAPTLTVVLVGDNPVSNLYIKQKIASANLVGIHSNVLHLDAEINEKYLREELIKLNEDENVDAVLLQLPLPNHINNSITDLISPEKDVDGFTSFNFGKLCLGYQTFIPCTALAVRTILQHIGKNITGKNAVVCGRSKHVGLPIAILLHSRHNNLGFEANTVICHRFTPPDRLTDFCRNADVLISATGIPSLIRGYMVKEGAIVIDVGISRVTDPVSSKTKLLGDVNFEEVSEVAAFITPVPGGVGPLTVAMLLKNTLLAAQQRKPRNII